MSIFSIGVSGLSAAQVALKTTSNNISNVYTPGYNRELTLLEDSTLAGGVEITAIQRQFDYFTANQLNQANSQLKSLESYEIQINQIDNLLADQNAGLAPLMQNFFSALSDLSAAPSDPAARQGVIGTANTLSAQFRSMGEYFEDMQQGINTQIESEITQINNTADLISKLNREIAISRARTGEEPNSLLNRRDQLVAELSERVEVKVYIQDGGAYNVSIGNGQPLVSGSDSYQLVPIASSLEPYKTVIGYEDSAGNVLELDETLFEEGRLGGLMTFRRETLDIVQNKVGQMAVTLAMEFNDQHLAGLDLNGDPGLEFFDIGEPVTFFSSRNVGTASFSAEIIDATQLQGVDYELRVSNAATGEFTIIPSDGTASFTATLDGSNQLTFDGVTMTLDDPALLVDGDRFNLLPTRDLAGSLSTLIQDSSLIAAGQIGGSGDNLNALALQDLQNSAIFGGSATLSQGYASIVSDVGNRTNIVQVNLSAQAGVTQQIRTLQQSESGVNMDEEAANLIRYQQYYQANAKVIEVGSTIIDTLLGIR